MKIKEKYMKEALKEARKAYDKGEVPIGAVIVKDDKIIARGHNLRESKKDPLAHAELIAIKKAAKKIGDWRLYGCSLYVTVEPCPMCAGAIVLSRIDELNIGTMDPKGGAVGSVMNILEGKKLNHEVKVDNYILQNECSEILKEFFRELRIKKSEKGK